jgi:hypothetical protein
MLYHDSRINRKQLLRDPGISPISSLSHSLSLYRLFSSLFLF